MKAHLGTRMLLALVAGAALAVLGGTSPSPAYAATFTVNSNNDVDDGTCNVAHCSLREAINASNASTGVKDTINFSIGTGKKTIKPAVSPLPTIMDPVIIDGTTQSCSPDSTPCIELDGTNAGAGADGLKITGGNSTVRGLVINRFSGYGIHLVTAGNNVIEGNYIGTDVAGAVALGNGTGVCIDGAPNNTVGGTAAGARNVISGTNGYGILISLDTASGNQVLGNYIGTNAAGSAALGNLWDGVEIIYAPNNTIGGTAAEARNVISGNKQGVSIYNATGNQMQGNYIGTDASGSAALPNTVCGVYLANNTDGNTIGGTAAGARTVISGNFSSAVVIANQANGNQVLGNYIGTNASGSAALGNVQGVSIQGHDNTIGGTAAGAGNTVAYNDTYGVVVVTVEEPPTGNAIRGNSIHSNGYGGIWLGSGGNGEIPAPIIDSVGGSATGHTSPKCYPCTVEVFSDSDGQGRIFHGSTATNNDATGTWTYPGAVTGPKITATVTDSSNNTSEFSAPYSLPAVGGIAELPVLAGASDQQAGAPADGSGWSAGGYAALACGLAAAAFAIAVGGWYARRRWLR
jgi:CSLREA domain-containing protein